VRPYATVSPLFWTGATGKRLRTLPDAQRVAFYLMTSPHSHQSGLYYLPLMYLCHEVGIDLEGARKALLSLSEEGFSEYDEASEWVWVCEMAAWQIGSELSETDKRCKGIQQYLTTLPQLPFMDSYVERYAPDFHLRATSARGMQGASGGASSEQSGTEQDQEQEKNKSKSDRASRLPDDFLLTQERRIVAEAERLPADRTFASFCDYWRAVPGAKGRKLDWDATWRNWCRTDADRRSQKPQHNGAPRPKAFPSS
jgi:hypothetical protein